MNLVTILVIVLIIALLGGIGPGPWNTNGRFYGGGPFLGGGLGLVVVVLVVLLLLGRI